MANLALKIQDPDYFYEKSSSFIGNIPWFEAREHICALILANMKTVTRMEATRIVRKILATKSQQLN